MSGKQLNGGTLGSVYKGSPDDYYFWAYTDSANQGPGTYSAQITIDSFYNLGNNINILYGIKIPVTLTVIQSMGSSSPIVVRVGQIILNNSVIQYVGNGGLYGFSSADALNSWGLSLSQALLANSAEAALPQLGIINSKQPGCLTPLDQIAGTCGN